MFTLCRESPFFLELETLSRWGSDFGRVDLAKCIGVILTWSVGQEQPQSIYTLRDDSPVFQRVTKDHPAVMLFTWVEMPFELLIILFIHKSSSGVHHPTLYGCT
jgi:hypothetical protein